MSAIDPVKLERHRPKLYEGGLLKSRLEAAGFVQVTEDVHILGRWLGSPEQYWRQFIEVAAPFRPLIAKLKSTMRERAEAQIFAELSVITMLLEIVFGTGLRT
jgi:hypothetical protein